jgi:hypothetical protein
MNQALFILIVISFLSLGCDKPNLSIPFDSQRWKNSDGTTRWRMKDDLIHNQKKKIIGLSRETLIELLGDPEIDSASYRARFGMSYYMIFGTTDSTYSECPCNLDVYFDSLSRVIDFQFRDM